MNKTQFKLFYKKIRKYAPLLSILISITGLSITLINWERTTRALELEESWRFAVSHAWNDKDAQPIRTLEGWRVGFSRKANQTINLRTFADVNVIRGNSTQTSVLDTVFDNSQAPN